MSVHIALIGTGFTSLTITRRLLLHRPALSFSLTIIDKARAPGGRLTSRTYAEPVKSVDAKAEVHGDAVTLETGARVFQSTTTGFHAELESLARSGWVREVTSADLRGTSQADGFPKGTRWWESVGGFSPGLIQRTVEEIEQEAQGNDQAQVRWKYNTTVLPSEDLASALYVKTEPQINRAEFSTGGNSAGPFDFVVHTAPTPQIEALLPWTAQSGTTGYLQTFCLLLPTLQPPASLPIYQRNPSKHLTAIASGISPTSPLTGLVIQATPQQLGLSYEREKTSDDDIRSAFVRVMTQDGDKSGIDSNLMDSIEAATRSDEAGKIAQIKRWKFAQVSAPPADQDEAPSSDGSTSGTEKQFQVVQPQLGNGISGSNNGGKVIIAGDGQSRRGGMEGAWESGRDVADWLIERLER